jgi:hypothetical protein
MEIGAVAVLVFCAAIIAACRIRSVSWLRTAFSTAIGIATLYISFGFALRLRLQYDEKLSPHDGQSGMDALAFAILVAPAASIAATLFFLWITKSKRSINGC